MRALHRWLMLAAIVPLLYVACTGVLLAGGDLWSLAHPDQRPVEVAAIHEGDGTLRAGPIRALAAPGLGTLTKADLPRLLTNTLAATKAAGHGPVTSITLRQEGTMVEGTVTLGGPDAQALRVNAATGALLDPPPPSTAGTWHIILKSWHRGNVFGLPGILINLVTGSLLALLSVTGTVLYFLMLGRRRALGRPEAFWS